MSQFDPAECNDMEMLRDMARCWIKLYMKQQETMTNIGMTPMDQPLPRRKDDEG